MWKYLLLEKPLSSETEILIVGSGPAGLMSAYAAASKGHDVTVIERLNHPGGMAASFEINGMRVDYGSHRLHPATSKPLLEICLLYTSPSPRD